MRVRDGWAQRASFLALAFACVCELAPHGATSSAPALASGTATAPCDQPFEVLVPFHEYEAFGLHDWIRAIAIDGLYVYYRTNMDVLRVPLVGGRPEVLTHSPDTLDGPLWVIDGRLVTQPTGQAVFLSMPLAGGPWTTWIDATATRQGPRAVHPPRLTEPVDPGLIEDAQPAVFDGTHFQWIEHDIGAVESGRPRDSTWKVRRVPIGGGQPEVLYEAREESLSGLAIADGNAFFVRRDA